MSNFKNLFNDKLCKIVSEIRRNSEAKALDTNWSARTKNKKSFVMICHDTSIDRRIIMEALSLQNKGWVGIVVALSRDQEDHLDYESDVTLHRIGLKRIVPECPAYYYSFIFERILSKLPRYLLPNYIKKLLYMAAYASLRLWFYHSIHGTPLPFDNAFYNASKHYRASFIQAHDLPALKTAAILARQWNVPLVYDAHEFYPEQISFTKRQKEILFSVEETYVRKCATIFIVNKSLGAIMGKKYNIKSPIELTNATDATGILDSSSNLFRKEFKINADAPIILFQGGFSANRNLKNLIRSMRYIRHPHAVLVLMGTGEFEKKLRHIAEREVPQGRVFFKDAVPQNELLSWTCTADIGIIPYPAIDINTKYCTPNKLFEFIQAGLPILANDLPELRRFILDTGFGQVTQMTTPKEIATGLDLMLYNTNFLINAKKTLYKRRNEYAWDVQAEKYTTVIESIVLN